MFKLILFVLMIFQSAFSKPVELVDVKSYSKSIMVEMKYLTADNFVGDLIDGYHKNKCLLTSQAAKSLAQAQSIANKKGFSLLVHDCYRPQRAVNHFVKWSKDIKNKKTKKKYYPNLEKNKLFKLGYIASKSGHSRGSTIDLTLYDLKSKKPLDMGTIYDFLDPLSNTENPKINLQAIKNRKLLVDLMKQAYFVNYDKEWWHYTLKDEPNKNKYLDYPVK
jgi:D-alanyl-D-alanine dipeptidase